MKLKNINDWKAIHFEDRTILQEDAKYFPKDMWKRSINALDVEEMEEKGHYRVIQK